MLHNALIELLTPYTDVAIAVVILIPFAILGMFLYKRKITFLKALAAKHNLVYVSKEPIDLMRSFRSRLFKYGRTIEATHVFEGVYADHRFVIFRNLFYTNRFKLEARSFSIGSCEFGNTEFPYIVLKSKKMKLYQDREANDTQIFLEQEYLKDFDLYCPQDYEIEILQIFTEDLLRAVSDISKDFSIEFGGNRLYVYLDKDIFNKRNEENFRKVIKIMHQIIDRTDGLLFRLKDDFEVLDEYYKK